MKRLAMRIDVMRRTAAAEIDEGADTGSAGGVVAGPVPGSQWDAVIGATLLSMLALALFTPSFLAGIPAGDSYHFNYAWTSALASQWSLADPYPRWLEAMWEGAGSADFHFYPPLFFVVAAGAMAVTGGGAVMGQLIAAMVFHALSGIGTASLARALGIGRYGALAAGVAVMLAPYHLLDWFIRNANAEIAAYPAIAFTMAGFARVLGEGRGHTMLALGAAASMFAHILAAPIAAVGCLAILMANRRGLSWRRLMPGIGIGLLGVLAAAVYWLPAVGLRDTVTASVLLSFHWSTNIFGLGTLLQDSLTGSIYRMALTLSLIALVLVLVGLARSEARASATVLGILGTVWFLMSPLGRGVWAYTPLEIMQFPWRFTLLLDIGVALAVGLGVDRLHRLRGPAAMVLHRRALGGLIAAAAVAAALFQPAWWRVEPYRIHAEWALASHVGVIEWLDFGEHEYSFHRGVLGRRGSVMPPLEGAPLIAVSGEGNRVEVLEDTPRDLRFAAACAVPCEIVVKRGFWRF
ncbi:MAG: hypothetical protein AAF698_07740, partial [Pseudomonadota bacterium]